MTECLNIDVDYIQKLVQYMPNPVTAVILVEVLQAIMYVSVGSNSDLTLVLLNYYYFLQIIIFV